MQDFSNIKKKSLFNTWLNCRRSSTLLIKSIKKNKILGTYTIAKIFLTLPVCLCQYLFETGWGGLKARTRAISELN